MPLMPLDEWKTYTHIEASKWKNDSQKKISECEIISRIAANLLCSYLHFYVRMIVLYVF